jgi:phosphoribosylcarboxyaminoimidazole (NCAIR) mutase
VQYINVLPWQSKPLIGLLSILSVVQVVPEDVCGAIYCVGAAATETGVALQLRLDYG